MRQQVSTAKTPSLIESRIGSARVACTNFRPGSSVAHCKAELRPLLQSAHLEARPGAPWREWRAPFSHPLRERALRRAGRNVMRIAVPHWQGRISPVFDAARKVLVVEIGEDGQQRREQHRLRKMAVAARAHVLLESVFSMPGLRGRRERFRGRSETMSASGAGGPGPACGRGRDGRRGGRRGGPAGECVCPACGEKAPRRAGEPCRQIKCPKCGAAMTRA